MIMRDEAIGRSHQTSQL